MATTPAHMVHSHGYRREYAQQQSLEQREAEHTRLHEDDTAEHLDHRHASSMPSTQDTLQDVVQRVRDAVYRGFEPNNPGKVVIGAWRDFDDSSQVLYAADVRALIEFAMRRVDTDTAARLIATALREYDAATPDDTWRDFTADQLAEYLVESLYGEQEETLPWNTPRAKAARTAARANLGYGPADTDV